MAVGGMLGYQPHDARVISTVVVSTSTAAWTAAGAASCFTSRLALTERFAVSTCTTCAAWVAQPLTPHTRAWASLLPSVYYRS